MSVTAVVSESALRELLTEALENDGAMGHDADPPVVPNAAMDRTSLQLDTDAVELRHLPRTRNELIVMVRNLLDEVPDDQSGELYKKIKDAFSTEQIGKLADPHRKGADRPLTPNIDQARELQRDPNKMEAKSISRVIRRIAEDAMAGATTSSPGMSAQVDDDLDEDAWSEGSAYTAREADGSDAGDEPAKAKGMERAAKARSMDEAEPVKPGKKRMGLGGAMSSPEDDDEEGPRGDFLDRGGSVSDEFKKSGEVNFDPKEDTIFDDELGDLSASAWDPEASEVGDDEDEDEPKPLKGRGRSKEIGAYGVDGATLEKIGEEFGFTKEAAMKAVETAMERFKALHEMDPEDRAELVLVGVSDYIDTLAKTGEMSEEEEEFMRLHPKVVAMSDNFRDFFAKYVKKAAREMRADTQDDEPL